VLDQHDPLDFPFTVAEVVALGRYPHGGLHGDQARIRELLHRVDALHLLDRSYPTLSGGEKQRVRLARALCQLDGPGVLLLDEPTSAQDLGQRQRLAALVDTLAHREGHLVVAIVHDLDLAANVDRILLLAEGRCIADGPPADVLQPSLIRRAFDLDVSVHHVAGRLVVLPSPPTPHPTPLESAC
jgi:iron complex transport system ATP-binding protein